MQSCRNTIKDESSFFKYLNNPENGLVKKASANGFTLTMKYLPPEYLTYLEQEKDDEQNMQRLEDRLKEFNNSITFLFSIEHEKQGVSVTNYGVADLRAYKQRMNELNFNIKDYIYLKNSKGNKFQPVLTTFENLYEVDGKKSFYIVFSKEMEQKVSSDKLDIMYEDEFFDTGISHFVFNKKNIDNIPNLQFIK